jgi:hypothetical protein
MKSFLLTATLFLSVSFVYSMQEKAVKQTDEIQKREDLYKMQQLLGDSSLLLKTLIEKNGTNQQVNEAVAQIGRSFAAVLSQINPAFNRKIANGSSSATQLLLSTRDKRGSPGALRRAHSESDL